ncbi:putative reverse transcriptase domain-containing protein [Tanacetum coccineum]
MPLSTYLNLGLGELAHTKLTVELANRTVKYPKGIAENVLVGIGKFVFPVDFIILDMPKDVKVPLILGRPLFLPPKLRLILEERMELDLEAKLMGETLVLNRPLDPLYGDYIELNDLNIPLELRRDQVDDLMPTIEEGKDQATVRIRKAKEEVCTAPCQMYTRVLSYPIKQFVLLALYDIGQYLFLDGFGFQTELFFKYHVTLHSVYIDSELWQKPSGEPIMRSSSPPITDYIPGPKDLQTLPVPQDEDEHEPIHLPNVDSPTAEFTYYITGGSEESEEYEDDEIEDGLVDYPIDGGNDRDADDGDSSRDDTDGEDEDKEDEDEDKEEEEHLAPADSTTTIPVDEPVFPPEGT